MAELEKEFQFSPICFSVSFVDEMCLRSFMLCRSHVEWFPAVFVCVI